MNRMRKLLFGGGRKSVKKPDEEPDEVIQAKQEKEEEETGNQQGVTTNKQHVPSPMDTDYIIAQIKCSDNDNDDGSAEDLDTSVPFSDREEEMATKAAKLLKSSFGKYDSDDFQMFQFMLSATLGALLVKTEQAYEQSEYTMKVQIAMMLKGLDQARALGTVGGEKMIAMVQALEAQAGKDQFNEQFVEEEDTNEPLLTVRLVDMEKIRNDNDFTAAATVCELNQFLTEVQLKRTMVKELGENFARRTVSRKTVRLALADKGAGISDCSILSWRWDIMKPPTLEEAKELRSKLVIEYLRSEKRRGKKFVWVDWMCVRQYTGFSIQEIKDTNQLYGVFPPVQLPRVKGSAYVPSNIFKFSHFASDYSSRAWTSAEYAKMVRNPRNKISQLVLMDPPSGASLQEKKRFLQTVYLGIFLSGLSLPVMNKVDQFLYHDGSMKVGEILDMVYDSAMRSARAVPADILKDKQAGRALLSTKLRAPYFEDWTEVELAPSHLRHALCTVVSRRVYALRAALSDAEKVKDLTIKDILPWCLAHADHLKDADDDADRDKRTAVLVAPKVLGKTAQQVLDEAPTDRRVLYLLVRIVQIVQFMLEAGDGTLEEFSVFHPSLVAMGSELGIIIDFFLREKPVLGVTNPGDLVGIADSMKCTYVPPEFERVAYGITINPSMTQEDIRLEKLKYFMTRELFAMMEFERIVIVCRPSFLLRLIQWMVSKEIITAAIPNTVYGVFLGLTILQYGDSEHGAMFSIAFGFPEGEDQAKIARGAAKLERTNEILKRLESGGECSEEASKYSGAETSDPSLFVYRELVQSNKYMGTNTTTKVVMPPDSAEEAGSLAAMERMLHCKGIDFEGDSIVYGVAEN